MRRFLHGHATHPDWRIALGLAAAQIDAQRDPSAGAPTLGWIYLTDRYADQAEALLGELRRRWPGVEWIGATGVGVAASGVEYFDEPALALLLTDLPRESFRVFSGAAPLRRFAASTAQVHADPAAADLNELIRDMSARTATGYLFGGLAASRETPVHIANDALAGGLSGVAFAADVEVVSRVTQGCQPFGPSREISAADGNVITVLDGEPALDCLLRDLRADSTDPRDALPRLRETMVGLSDPNDACDDGAASGARRGAFGADTRVRHLIGIDTARRGIAIGDLAEPGMRLAFCSRNAEAARRDLMRICAEIREETEPEALPLATAEALKNAGPSEPGPTQSGIAGAIYISCAGRGGPHFGAPSAELQIVRHALGDVPLAGFFAAGEIARHHVYGYTGVLTVFRADPD
ncbi:MAG: FIST N-terminal domain-containing protein [Caldimonas sp.]